MALLLMSGAGAVYASPIITGIRQLESGESPRFDIRLDQPAQYEAYQMPQVLRYVIDLHNVEPGMVSNLTKLDTLSVKRVLLQQKNLNGLQMTRVIFDLSRDMVGRVIVDEGGKRLLVTFAPPISASPLLAPPAPAAYPATPMPTPTATVVNQLPPLLKKPLVPVVPEKGGVSVAPNNVPTQPAAAATAQAAVMNELLTAASTPAPVPVQVPTPVPATVLTPVPAPAPVPAIPAVVATPAPVPKTEQGGQNGAPRILAIKVEADGVLIETATAVVNYTTSVYRKPGKLIIDLPPGVTQVDKAVAINAFGMRTLRIGQSRERLRLVIDAAGDQVPPHEIKRTAQGIKILFSQFTGKLPPAATGSKPATAAPVAASTERRVPPTIQAIRVDGEGILVEISGTYDPYLPSTQRKPGKLIIDLPPGSSRVASTVPINRFGIKALRIGQAPTHLRLVFDATSDLVRSHEIHRVTNGFKIRFPSH